MTNLHTYGRACPTCGNVERTLPGEAPPRFCGRCGSNLDPGMWDEALDFRSTGVAYALWALCLVAVSGVHRLYTGRYITGVIWLLTWGLLGIGNFIDLFLIPSLVRRKNRELARSFGY